MWRDKQIKFLTESKFSESEIINILEEDFSKIHNKLDEEILGRIINDFKANDFSLLSSLEVTYLTRN